MHGDDGLQDAYDAIGVVYQQPNEGVGSSFMTGLVVKQNGRTCAMSSFMYEPVTCSLSSFGHEGGGEGVKSREGGDAAR